MTGPLFTENWWILNFWMFFQKQTRTHTVLWVVWCPGLSPRPGTAPQLVLLQPNGSDHCMCTDIDFTQPTSLWCLSACLCNRGQKISDRARTNNDCHKREFMPWLWNTYVHMCVWAQSLCVSHDHLPQCVQNLARSVSPCEHKQNKQQGMGLESSTAG